MAQWQFLLCLQTFTSPVVEPIYIHDYALTRGCRLCSSTYWYDMSGRLRTTRTILLELEAAPREDADRLVAVMNGAGEIDKKIVPERDLAPYIRLINACDDIFRNHGYPTIDCRWDPDFAALLEPKADVLVKKLWRMRASGSMRLGLPNRKGWTPKVQGISLGRLHYWISMVDWLAMSGHLRRVRECRLCVQWFRAHRADQRFCSGACKEKYFRSSPQGKAARRDYMRNYRARDKKRTERELENVRKKGR